MKPTTDEGVRTLIKGLEMREKTAFKRLNEKIAATRAEAGSMTARVLRFSPRSCGAPDDCAGPAEVRDLAETCRSMRSGRTVSGLFHYTAQL